jgi:hypothetical protein
MGNAMSIKDNGVRSTIALSPTSHGAYFSQLTLFIQRVLENDIPSGNYS